MKRFICFSLLLVLFSCQSGHLRFKDIPINGSVESFSRELEKKGLEISETARSFSDINGKNVIIGQVLFEGEYVWRSEEITLLPTARIQVYGTKITGSVYRVDKSFERSHLGRNTYYYDVDGFVSYMELLSSKYGEPILKKVYDYVDVSDIDDILAGNDITMEDFKDTIAEPLKKREFRWVWAFGDYYCSLFEAKQGYILLRLWLSIDPLGDAEDVDSSLEIQYLDKKNSLKAPIEEIKYEEIKKGEILRDL